MVMSDISDHFPIVLFVNLACKPAPSRCKIITEVLNERTLQQLCESLETKAWTNVYDVRDPNTAYNSLIYEILLFIIYIKNFVNSSKILHKVIFAVDTNLFLLHKNTLELQDLLNAELQKIDTWFKCNKLSLHISKTNYIVFRSNKNALDMDHICLKVNYKELLRVNSTKFLEVLIDESINFRHHMEHLISK